MDPQFSAAISRPLDEVFAFVSDFENYPQWEGNFAEVKKVSLGPIGVGTEYDCLLRLPGRSVRSHIAITQYQQNALVAFRGDQPRSMKPAGSIRFERTLAAHASRSCRSPRCTVCSHCSLR